MGKKFVNNIWAIVLIKTLHQGKSYVEWSLVLKIFVNSFPLNPVWWVASLCSFSVCVHYSRHFYSLAVEKIYSSESAVSYTTFDMKARIHVKIFWC